MIERKPIADFIWFLLSVICVYSDARAEISKLWDKTWRARALVRDIGRIFV